jgi:hypothetical protein
MKSAIQGLLGKVLMTIATFGLGILPLKVDLSPTHVLNPTWPAHARLHEVWLLSTGALIAMLVLYFVWVHRPTSRGALLIAFVLLSCLAGGFFIAAGTAESYGGVLVDPLTASQMPMNDMFMGIPLNLFAFSVAWILGMIGWVLTRKGSA